MKIPNRILAISTDAPAIPPKPKIPATIATTRKTNAQYSITFRSPYEIYAIGLGRLLMLSGQRNWHAASR